MDPKLSALIQTYAALEAPVRDVVIVLAAILVPVSRSALAQLLDMAESHAPGGKRWNHKIVKSVTEELAKAGLVATVVNQVICAPMFCELALRRAAREGRLEKFEPGLRKIFKRFTPWGGWGRRTYEEVLRDFRLALYLGQAEAVADCLRELSGLGYPLSLVLNAVLGNPFEPEVLSWLPEGPTAQYLAGAVTAAHVRLDQPEPEILACTQELVQNRGQDAPALVLYALAERTFLQGDWAAAQALVGGHEEAGNAAILGAIAFLQGDDAAALSHYQQGLKYLRASTGKRKVFFAGIPGLFFVFALLRSGTAKHRKEALTHVRAELSQNAHLWRGTYPALEALLKVLQGEAPAPASEAPLFVDNGLSLAERLVAARAARHDTQRSATQPQSGEPPTLDTWGMALCDYWLGKRQAAGRGEALETLCSTAAAGNYRLVEAVTAELLGTLNRGNYGARAEELQGELGLRPVVPVVAREEPWERTLAAALDVFQATTDAQTTAPGESSRLAWFLAWYGATPHLRPVEQKRNVRGEWSWGRNVSLKRLQEQAGRLAFLTPQDVQACAAIGLQGGSNYWDRPTLAIDAQRALAALVGHPLVFLEGSPGTRVEVLRGEPELRVVRKGRQLVLQVEPTLDAAAGPHIIQDLPTRVRVVEFGTRARRLAELFGTKGLKVPDQAEERVRQVLAAVAGELTVHTDEAAPENLEEHPADPRPRLQLLPAGQGFRVSLWVRPGGNGGPYCVPGAGSKTLIVTLETRKVVVRRDLDAERQAVEQVLAACPALYADANAGEGEPLTWVLEAPENCLDLLLQLQNLGEAAVVEWPEGETLKPPYRAGLDTLQLTFRKEKDWFAADGEVRIDTELTLSLRQLLDLAATSPGRFLPLGEGRFLSLTQTFRKRLDELQNFTEAHGKGLRFHPLAAPALEECAADAGNFKGDKGWKDLVRRFQEAQGLNPEVPSTLAAELRPYQLDGYRWLMRLAHWGVGACLADDMGLGKTLQALALLLTRAKNGPCLVVAPTSVCLNWAAEAQRFAPSLQPVIFGPGNREKTLAGLQPFDLVLTSYGLLLQEAENLAAVPWEVVVLDEAQAIKNVAAKRSRAAMELRAGFKVITTGTPVENHLGELWNLFRFVNPGLLGSQESFQRRFTAPIESGDSAARNRLKRLISPFLLRRTKSQVLDDLPPRTEILRRVEFGPEEAALYEALRSRALERLDAYEGPPLAKRFQVLAELMRLRRACCHPRLVLPEAPLSSAKLESFGEILDELTANRHKALVFSQFVDHLSIVREYVESRGVAYQYLDGSTPARERKRRVDAFQAGEGELFLISLKAGGLGLNLTAADYVVHLDPWWNPAVEDQASDRAHRIGQTRPVTIYRLVAKGSIEEKIVDLHRHKRDLADSLLEDADGGGRLTADDLLEILRGA